MGHHGKSWRASGGVAINPLGNSQGEKAEGETGQEEGPEESQEERATQAMPAPGSRASASVGVGVPPSVSMSTASGLRCLRSGAVLGGLEYGLAASAILALRGCFLAPDWLSASSVSEKD